MSKSEFVADIIRDMLIQAYTHDYYSRLNFYYSRGMEPTREDRIHLSKKAWAEANSCAETFQVAHVDMLKMLDPEFVLPSELTEEEKKQRDRITEELGLKAPNNDKE